MGSVLGEFVSRLRELDRVEDMTILDWLEYKVFTDGYVSGDSFEGYGCTFECVGRGDCGIVFRVSDGVSVVALKVSNIDIVFDYRLDLNDGYALTTIHERLPNATFVPCLFDYGSFYTVVEYVEGKTLAASFEGDTVGFEDFMGIYEEIENTLTVLLRDGILAIDVTVYNVMMLADGSWKIVDVGAFEIFDDMEHVESSYGDEAWDILQEQMDGLREFFGNV